MVTGRKEERTVLARSHWRKSERPHCRWLATICIGTEDEITVAPERTGSRGEFSNRCNL